MAEPPSGAEGIEYHRVLGEPLVELDEDAGALLANGEEPRGAHRLQVARDVGLALVEELRQLADRQLLFRGQGKKPQPDRLTEELVELPARGFGDGDRGHDPSIFEVAHERK